MSTSIIQIGEGEFINAESILYVRFALDGKTAYSAEITSIGGTTLSLKGEAASVLYRYISNLRITV